MTTTTKSNLLRSAGIISLLLALFQAVISFSPAWSLYFGAPPELTENPTLLIVFSLIVSIIFIIFGLYAFSGAGDIHPLPFLRSGLVIIGSIYTLRGMLVILQILILFNVMQVDEEVTPQLILSSISSLLIGIIYLTGTFKNWHSITQLSISEKS